MSRLERFNYITLALKTANKKSQKFGIFTIVSRKGRKVGCIKERKKGRMYLGNEESIMH